MAAVLVVGALVAGALWYGGWPAIRREGTVTAATLFDLLKLIFAVVAGIGGVAALVVAYRRQRVAEHANKLAEFAHELAHAADLRAEAADGRAELEADRNGIRLFNERFAKASEQLGSTEPAIRLAGAYAMLNLGSDWPVGRQMCVDVLCGYLRMPFNISPDDVDINPLKTGRAVVDEDVDTGAGSSAGATSRIAPNHEIRQEFQVRLAIQRTLAAHLRNANKRHSTREEILDYWPEVRIDLFGATLCNFDLAGCNVAWCDFRKARFVGDARFGQFTVDHESNFTGASFLGHVGFSGANFREHASFCGVSFSGDAHFNATRFGMDGEFNEATFDQTANFKGAKFGAGAWFPAVIFGGQVQFEASVAKDGHHFDDAKVKLPKLAHRWPSGLTVKQGGVHGGAKQP